MLHDSALYKFMIDIDIDIDTGFYGSRCIVNVSMTLPSTLHNYLIEIKFKTAFVVTSCSCVPTLLNE